MKKAKDILNQAIQVATLVALGVGIVILFRTVSGWNTTSLANDTNQFQTTSVMQTQPIIDVPYPPPVETEPPRTLPTSTPTFRPPSESPTSPDVPPEFPPLPNTRIVSLFNDDVWLFETGKSSRKITDHADVSTIFGYNSDGTSLLFGRGRNYQGEHTGDTTDLWMVDINSGKDIQLTKSGLVKSASWSPINNQIAYCEHGNLMTIIDQVGNYLQQLENVICEFTWSPDGMAIAVTTYTEDMIADDGYKHTVLSIWWPSDQHVQSLSNAKKEVHSNPVWAVDGQSILFQIHSFSSDPDSYKSDGWYIADVASGTISYLGGPNLLAVQVSRSPRANRVTFKIGQEIFIMDFDGSFEKIGEGDSPSWLDDGNKLVYRSLDSTINTIDFPFAISEQISRGNMPSQGLYMQKEFIIIPGGQQ